MNAPTDYRSFFPYLRTGRIYLDHASTAPYSLRVVERLRQQAEFRARGRIEYFPDTLRLITDTRRLTAGMVGCEPDRIAFVQNTSDGLNILAGGLPWKTGDRILLNDLEFPSNVYPFLNQKRHGVEIDFVRNRDDRVDIEDIERAITPRTRLLSISWVQFLSGYKCDLHAIGELCRKNGIVFCVDAIQGLGAQQLDVVESGIDFLSCGAQKWLLAPQGIGFIYLTEELQSRIRQENVGWLGVKKAWDFFDYNLDLLDSAQRYEGATYNTLGVAGLHGSLSLFTEIGFAKVERLVNDLASHTFGLLAGKEFALMTPADETKRAGIVSFRHERSEDIYQYLVEQNVHVSERVGCIRISPHFYNTCEEIDIAVNMIMMCLD